MLDAYNVAISHFFPSPTQACSLGEQGGVVPLLESSQAPPPELGGKEGHLSASQQVSNPSQRWGWERRAAGGDLVCQNLFPSPNKNAPP